MRRQMCHTVRHQPCLHSLRFTATISNQGGRSSLRLLDLRLLAMVLPLSRRRSRSTRLVTPTACVHIFAFLGLPALVYITNLPPPAVSGTQSIFDTLRSEWHGGCKRWEEG